MYFGLLIVGPMMYYFAIFGQVLPWIGVIEVLTGVMQKVLDHLLLGFSLSDFLAMGHDQILVAAYFELFIEAYLLITRELVVSLATVHGTAGLIDVVQVQIAQRTISIHIGSLQRPVQLGRLNIVRTLVTLLDVKVFETRLG